MICKKKNATSNVIHVGATGDSIKKDVNNNLQKRTSEVLDYSSTFPTMGSDILLSVPMPPPPVLLFLQSLLFATENTLCTGKGMFILVQNAFSGLFIFRLMFINILHLQTQSKTKTTISHQSPPPIYYC